MSPSSFPFLNYFFLRMLANSPIFCGVVRGDRCQREFFSRHLRIGYSQVISSFLSSRIQPRNSIQIVIQIVTNFPISICIIQHEARTSPVLHRTHPPSPSTLERRWSYFERNKRFARFDYKLRRIYDERWKGIRDRRRTGRGCLKATAFR